MDRAEKKSRVSRWNSPSGIRGVDLLPWRHSLTLEQYHPSPVMLLHFYYWLQGAYLFQGYQEGLREFQLAGTQG